MSTSPIIFRARTFVATAQELLNIAANSVYNTYPPYNLDIYNNYIQQTTVAPTRTFIPRPIPKPPPDVQNIPVIKQNIQNKTEGDMLSYNTNHCDIFASDWDYDLDWDRLTENQITVNYLSAYLPRQFDPRTSGIWRPFFLYIDAQNPANRNSFVSSSASAQENQYEAGLSWPNAINIQNPVFKSWNLSGGVSFQIDWTIEKDNFLTCPVLGLLFWYRHYDIDRESNIKKTFTIQSYEENITEVNIPEAKWQNITYPGQSGYLNYANSSSHVNVERYGLHSDLNIGDKVLILEGGKEYIYEVTNDYWINLGEKRFMSGMDIYVPDDQFTVYFESEQDRADWFSDNPGDKSSFSYPRSQLKTQDPDRYSNMLNKLLNFENNNNLQNLFQLNRIPGQSKPYIYKDEQIQLNYIAIKNLARFLCTAPIAASEYVKTTDIILENLNFKNFSNIYALKTSLENIFGHTTATSGRGPSIMPANYTGNIKAQNDINKSVFNGSLVNTKKDLLTAIFRKSKKNRFVKFPKGQKTQIVSKFNIEEPHIRILMDFQDKKTLGTNANNNSGVWYKQKIHAAGLQLYTRLKFPDESALAPNENEAIALEYIDRNGNKNNKRDIPISSSFSTLISSKEYYNQAISSVYEKFGIARLFQQKYNIENNFLIRENQIDFYDVTLTDHRNNSFKIIKNKTYQENQTFDNAVRFFKYNIDEYARTVPKFDQTMRMVEQRFRDMGRGAQAGILPNIKEVFMHRLGGFYLANVSFLTTGLNNFFRSRTGPNAMAQNQYFLPESIRGDVTAKPANDRKIIIEFECGDDTDIELYTITISKLRDDKIERATCRPFPNKVPVYGDEISVYNAIIGYDYNEETHLLTTQFAPPIVSYGGHRIESIAELGVNIPGHPPPISAVSGIYNITQNNILPLAAKNSVYHDRNWRQTQTWDRSLVKCFLTPADFANEVVFRKGFFHPNKGWIDYTLMTADIINKTAVKEASESPCKIYTGKGALFRELTLTVTEDKAKAGSEGPPPGRPNIDLITRDPMEVYGDGDRQVSAIPNLLTVDIDPNTDFITYMSVILKNFTHPVPKELKIALFDSLEQRWIAFTYIKAYLTKLSKNRVANEDPSYAQKIQRQIAKEQNAWLGPWFNRERSSPRNVLFHSSLLNYTSNFNLILGNFARKNLDYAFNNDFVAPAQSLDYYIGTSGTYTGFWNYDGPIPAGVDVNEAIDGGGIPEDQPPFVGEPSDEVGRTWGLQISDVGAEDEGGSCFDLQVCTGCPVEGYTQSYIYSRFLYNAETFNRSYKNGYNFIANFRNKKHLLPPINLDAPYKTINPEYPKQNVGINYPVQLSCVPQPDPPRPRETILPVFPPPPIFIPPAHPSIVGLLTYMSMAMQLQEQGYGWDLGFLTGVFFPSPFYFGTTRREKLGRYMENKGYLQVEGSTPEAQQLFGFQSRDISLYDDAPFGQADKVQLEIKHPNGLWYNVEADIFKYSSNCSPVLENTKFHYLKYAKYLNEQVPPTTSEDDDNEEDDEDPAANIYAAPLSYPSFDLSIHTLIRNSVMSIDGVRAYYAFMQGEKLQIQYKTVYTTMLTRDTEDSNCVVCEKKEVIESHSIVVTITNIYIQKVKNPWYVETELGLSSDLLEGEESLEGTYPDDLIDETSNPLDIYTSTTIIEFDPPIDFSVSDPNGIGSKTFIEGAIWKAPANNSKTSSFVLFDPIVTNGKIAPTGEINYKKGNNDLATPKMYAGFKELSGLTYLNNNDVINFGKWSNIRDRSPGTFTYSYPYDQLFAEGGLGWGTNLINPEPVPVIGNNEKQLTLLDLDYHYGKSNYCGWMKFTKGYDPNNTYTTYFRYSPRLVYPNMPKHPYSVAKQDGFIYFTGYPAPLEVLTDRIYAHNILNISEQNANILNINGSELYQRYKQNSDVLDYYLPFYDLTLGNNVLDESLGPASNVVQPGIASAASGTVQFENIFNNNSKVIYDNDYYWISIPAEASGVISGSSKIPIAVLQKCFHSRGTFSYCSNMCNTEGRGPVWPDFNDWRRWGFGTVYKLPSENVPRAPGIVYEERQTKQTYYVGCGEIKNDSLVRMDVVQIYEVPVQSNTYVPVSELLSNNEIKVRFKYLPRKIPTDFQVTLGNNIVNQSQLYFWECHRTNARHLYNSTTVTTTPPFYQILNEMIFRAWFGERQKIALQDTYDNKIFITQNHYRWVPYDYDDTGRFSQERTI